MIKTHWKIVTSCILAGLLGMALYRWSVDLYLDHQFVHEVRLLNEAARAAQAAQQAAQQARPK